MPKGKGEIWWVVIVSTNVLKVISSFFKNAIYFGYGKR